jgi:hypothetical protein
MVAEEVATVKLPRANLGYSCDSNYLVPCNRLSFEKLLVTQLAKKCPDLVESEGLSPGSQGRTIGPYPEPVWFNQHLQILISSVPFLYLYRYLGFPSDFLSWDFPFWPKFFYECLLYPCCKSCPCFPVCFNHLKVFFERCILQRSSSSHFPFFGPNTGPSISFSNALLSHNESLTSRRTEFKVLRRRDRKINYLITYKLWYCILITHIYILRVNTSYKNKHILFNITFLFCDKIVLG